MIARRFGLAVFISCAGVGSANAQILSQNEQPFFVAPISGVSGSTIRGNCVLFAPPTPVRLQLRCTDIQGGRTLSTLQIVELDHVYGERALFSTTVPSGPTIVCDVANAEALARILRDTQAGTLGIRLNTSAGPEGFGRFAPADETRTLFPLVAVQGGQDRLGVCELSTLPSPPTLGIFCEHNISSPTSFIFHAGTVANRDEELFRFNFTGSSGNDTISVLTDASPALINAINTQNTNANILGGSNWIAGNNMSCHPGPSTLCLNGNRFRVQVDVRNGEGQTGAARPAASGDDEGLFYFFDPSNVDMLVKVLNGCSTSSRYWVFASATTSIQVTLNVTDTTSGQTKTYINPQGSPFNAVTDTSAFATCP